jgi:low affinity Fe/Cu permease
LVDKSNRPKSRARVQTRLERSINALAAFLSTAIGFVVVFLVLCVGIAIGWLLQFNEGFMFGFNIFLSVAAIVISGIILVSAARGEAAIQVKLDYLIEYSKATNKAVGLEHKDFAEIEEERKRVEKEAAKDLEEAIEDEVEEEVAEQMGKRRAAKPKAAAKPARAARRRVSRAPSGS